jgi:hypothetical protein
VSVSVTDRVCVTVPRSLEPLVRSGVAPAGANAPADWAVVTAASAAIATDDASLVLRDIVPPR